jgi:hypothetical protein
VSGQIDGWYDTVGFGWRTILVDLHHKLLEISPEYVVVQVKQKWGGLKVYLDAGELPALRQREFDQTVRDAEGASYYVCEDCGEPGTPRGQQSPVSWIRTLCDTCNMGGLRIGMIQ